MYAYVNNVAVLIDDAYHLLIRVAHGHAHQAAKLSNAEVDVYDKVARLHLLQLFHRECHLASTGGVAAQTVFMETVKYLVVSEEACLHGVVGKAFVQGVVDGGEGQIFAFGLHLVRVEDVAQTASLLLAVGQDV